MGSGRKAFARTESSQASLVVRFRMHAGRESRGRNEAGGKDHLSCLFKSHVAFEDFVIVHENEESGHGIGRGGNKDRGGGFACLRIDKAAGDEANEPGPWAGILDISDTFEFLRSTQISNGVDKLLNGGIDESQQWNAADKAINPAGDFFTRAIRHGQADDEEKSEWNEKPKEVIAREAIERPRFLFLGVSQGVEKFEDAIDNRESDFV